MKQFLQKEVKDNLIPIITDFIKIPNQSRAFCDHETNMSQQKQAIEFARVWFMNQGIDRAGIHVLQDDDKPPVLMIIVESEVEKPTVLMYGHLDKQPPLHEGWLEGTGPYEPKIIDGKLYGRGGADDGYAFFSSTLIIKALQQQKIQHNRFILFFETDEESGSRDLLYYLDKNKESLKDPALLLCLDSSISDYEHFCITTTLRGVANFTLNIQVLSEGVHSGLSSGVIPDSFRIGRHLIDQFEDVKTGMLPECLYVNIPSDKYKQAEDFLKSQNGVIDFQFPFLEGVEPVSQDSFQQYLNNIWRPTLTTIGIDHIPNVKNAGNVLRPQTTFGLSVRLPPSLPIDDVQENIVQFFTKTNKPLYNAKVTVDNFHVGQGFNAPQFDDKLQKIMEDCSLEIFEKPMICYGGGGSIPFIGGFAELFPKAQFIVTGLLGPKSNAHAPNEFLHLDYLEKLVLNIARMMEEYAKLQIIHYQYYKLNVRLKK